ncbi:conserved hypothetical protein [Leishmania major strain Friedlin]|uniref:Uncharacterized protein n=1 Tax=Leishmania major TaxID=5664 RepID=Q4Q4K4_LEIMA|nr:conserved hypothetical protein [Leishmania major strain Friedlin]CAG9580570.1 hypothetical_protein_-_conserved [Leishmania major strain Friedlin]CAJ05871.1 conserved hypothetical protein [Leishmania major strain Friedlin]|eukprot:XP_001685744.1 conserved hypothetical protein [Leishmania major strain Friedlin]
MGGYIGYNLVYNQQASVSQALWSREDEDVAPVSMPVRPRVALVNMTENLRSCAMGGLRAWLDVADEVELEFPTVTFVEDDEAGAIAGLAAEVRRAALFAWVELKERHEMDAPFGVKPLCCVVFRSITEVDGQALDAWDVQEVELRRWHGKRFVTRHCVGASVDGKRAMVLMHDVEGVIDVGPAAALAGGRVSDCGALVRQYGAPSTASFRRWKLSAEAQSSSTPVQPPAKSLQGLGIRLRDGQRCQLWQSPLHIFAALGAVLRYNRADAAVYPNHITTPVPVSQSASAVSASLWGCVKEWALRCTPTLLHWYTARQAERMERQRQLSSTFVVVVRLAEERAAVTSDVLRVVEEHVAEWMRDMNGASPMKTSLSTANRVCVRDAAARPEELMAAPTIQVDLTDTVCSVIAAEWLLIRLTSLFAALGLEPALAQLVAVPGPQASTSLLYPTPNTAHLRHLWLSRSATTSSSTITDNDAKSPRVTWSGRTTQGEHIAGCAATMPIEAGYVVSEHYFSAF